MIFVSGHPRSGNHWLENQIRLLLFWAKGRTVTVPELHKQIVWSMLGYEAEGFHADARLRPPPQISLLPKNPSTFLLREAKSVITSFFYYINYTLMNRLAPAVQASGRAKVPQKMEQFVLGPWGISRYCRYLNELSRFWRVNNVAPRLIFYEAIGDLAVIKRLPFVIGWDNELSDKDALFIQRNTNFQRLKKGEIDQEVREGFPNLAMSATNISKDGKLGVYRHGTQDSYKQELSEDLVSHIDSYLAKHCQMPEYYQNYIKGK